jgi:TRAP-type mannitol/chloroaromatic compound transport system permease large subunit
LIISILGWPLEWTEIIVIFMPIFIPLLDNFGVDLLFVGLRAALNLQTAFLSRPVAMSAFFYLKGVSPPHVTLRSWASRSSPSCCCTSSRRSVCGCRRCCTAEVLIERR